MKYTEEEINALKNNPLIKLAGIFTNESIDDLVNSYLEEVEKQEAMNSAKAAIKNEETIPETKTKDVILDHQYDCQNPDELVEEGSKKTMKLEDFRKWINDYQNLENLFRKLEYTFGITLDSIQVKHNDLVWNLIKVIFGEDGEEKIADFCFGNSNFNSVEELYSNL